MGAQSNGITIKVFIIATLTFSIASPIGLSLGIGLSHLQKNLARDIANGTLQVKCILFLEGALLKYFNVKRIELHDLISFVFRASLVEHSCILLFSKYCHTSLHQLQSRDL